MKILLYAINSKYVHTNLAVRYIKSYCSGFDIDFREYTINDPLHSVISSIYAENPDIVGFSCYIWNISYVLKVCSSLKKILPKCLILLGGPEVSFDSRELMERHEFIDFIIKGEGEVSSLQLFKYLSNKSLDIGDVGGLVYRIDNMIYENSECELIDNLDTIPFPYEGEIGRLANKILYYESSRGCPYNCSYCLSSTIKGVRFFSLDRVKRDLMFFIDNDVRLVKFVDRTFNTGKQYVDILNFLVSNRKNTRFHFEISGDLLDEKMLEFFKTVPEGLFQFEIGVQSTNEDVLSKVVRKSNLDRLFHNILSIREKGNINVHLDLIAGLPGEGYESFKKSFNDCCRLNPDMLQLGFLKLLKGSSLRKNAGSLGIIFNEYPPYEVLRTDDLSYGELCELKRVESVVDRFYNSGRFNASIMYLNGIFKDAFSLFNALCDFQNKSPYGDRSLSNAEQYRLLYDFSTDYSEVDKEIFKECLAFDFLKQGRNPSIPDFLRNVPGDERQYVWDFLSNQNNLVDYFPNYEERAVKDIMKDLAVRRFSFDIFNYMESGKIDHIPIIAVFDYGSKNNSGQVYSFGLSL